MKHAVPASQRSAAAPSSPLDAYDFEDASVATQEVVGACKRRDCHNRAKAKRQQRNSQRVATASEPFRFADARSQDPAVFAHLLADHFVAREASNAAAAPPPAPAKPQQLTRPVAGSASLGSFRSWQFGERCLATYRVLFGRPLWATTTLTSVPPASPRPRKRKHATPPTSNSSDGSEDGVDQLNALELEETGAVGELLALPTVDELLELPTDDSFELDGKADGDAAPLEEDVLAELAIDLDAGLGPDADTGADCIDLLWEFDASDVDGGVMLAEGEDEELRFLATSPSAFAPVSPDGEDMEDI
ncbi:hypothetical protein PHYPSEUDO_010542 [Phytophthora pseudosyringae]|uniref:Uncharacterized protein n=1 Tax=Phytophthora pseudosyringae TaxID=221518 RepID=A0A8T1VDG4_9STRA|nr:hypothetical protein PHYPSEUDO_010542 [Phytophthora pseudosyringae]